MTVLALAAVGMVAMEAVLTNGLLVAAVAAATAVMAAQQVLLMLAAAVVAFLTITEKAETAAVPAGGYLLIWQGIPAVV